MSQVIEITGTTGVGPYDVYLCDITLTYCYLISGSTAIPPSVIFELPLIFQGVQSVIVKIIDLDNNCEHFNLYNCPVTPTPSPTATPTPTPTPTPMCSCIEAVNSGATIGSFQYTYCNGGISGVIPVDPYVNIFVCGNSPINPINVTINIGNDCVDGSCV